MLDMPGISAMALLSEESFMPDMPDMPDMPPALRGVPIGRPGRVLRTPVSTT